jgi:hypothetical protein
MPPVRPRKRSAPLQRAPYLFFCPQLKDHLARSSTVQQNVLKFDREPRDPSPAIQLRLTVAIRAACREIRAQRPRFEPQPGSGELAPELVRRVERMLLLPHANVRGVARSVGVDKSTVQAIAKKTRAAALRCDGCGGLVAEPDAPCRLCDVRRSACGGRRSAAGGQVGQPARRAVSL